MRMRYEEWLVRVPESLKKDPIRKFEAYPKALLLFDLVWEDSEKLIRDTRGREIARQLVRSAGSVSAPTLTRALDAALTEESTCNFCAMHWVLPGKPAVGTTNRAIS